MCRIIISEEIRTKQVLVLVDKSVQKAIHLGVKTFLLNF